MFSLLMIAIGLGLIVQSFSSGGPITGRLLLGLLFAAAGAGRTYIELRRGRGE